MNMVLLLLVLLFGIIWCFVIYMVFFSEVLYFFGFLIELIFFIILFEGDVKFNLVNGLLL